MKPRVLITALTCSAILTTTLTPVIAATTHVVPTTQLTTNPAGLTQHRVMDADFSQSLPRDLAQPQLAFLTSGQPKLGLDATMTGPVAQFDGQSGFLMPFTPDRYAQLANGMAIEAYFKYDGSTTGEHDIFSNQESGGLGLGVENGQVTFFAHVGGSYKTPQAPFRQGHWVHAVGVYDKAQQVVKLYLDGQLVAQKAAPGELKFAQGTQVNNFVLGGDSGTNQRVQMPMTGAIKTARLYDRSLSDSEVSQLNQTAQTDKKETEVATQQVVESKLVGAKSVVNGHTYGLNVHARAAVAGDADAVTVDVNYDAAKFEFVDANQTLAGAQTTVTKLAPGQVRITTTAKLATDDFRQYGATRLAHLNFKAKASGTTTMKLTSTDATMKLNADQPITIQAKASQDYNGDGVIGVGDVALAPKDQQAAVAKQSEIKPYKHVIVLTTDGGGNPWNPQGMYYAKSDADRPVWTTDPTILAKRKNTYTLDLFNKQFAMSTDAQAVVPTISAQNYVSMLHGRAWGTLPKGYQATNSSAGKEYFADFNQPVAQFPSIFKVLQQHNPTQGLAAFAEWRPILNGITEPDAAVMTQPSEKLKSFDDVADYIGKPEFANTSLVYMQSDYMDGQGHSKGWYNDNYWQQYAQYDGLFKKVMDKLTATGHQHDTLVIANADHGGVGRNHGQDETNPNRNIFLALGGETIDSGRRLKGGSNADISPLILNALQVPQPSQMLGEVFDKSAFLDQTALAKKKRAVEAIKLAQTTKKVTLSLDQQGQKHDIRAAEMRIDLAGQTVDKVKVAAGTTIVSQTIENNQLKLVLSFDQQPTSDIATISLMPAKTKSSQPMAVKQAMLGTAKGEEILVDLVNNPVITGDQDQGAGVTKPGAGSSSNASSSSSSQASSSSSSAASFSAGQASSASSSSSSQAGSSSYLTSSSSSSAGSSSHSTSSSSSQAGSLSSTSSSSSNGQVPGHSGAGDGGTKSSGSNGQLEIPGDDDKKINDSSEKSNTPTKSHSSKNNHGWLPQTSEQVQSTLAIVGGALLAISLGWLAWWRRQH
ncbi:cell surface protein [Lactobacillus sp. CBA3606]|uniref:LamG-like jellyroll fold domain-containing protein n=1 Tax=Lactobacillus sp. CBA3606 TaxID=2099789 RepID=UPI000CFBD0A1|nr:LamG-like jellyroll fold domain-containing protein [Lactobacillus sp. CBA3606]AVK63799.1 cell surface protein [Lactobacillus sp. CBA3606]